MKAAALGLLLVLPAGVLPPPSVADGTSGDTYLRYMSPSGAAALAAPAADETPYDLPEAVRIELLRLEETYHVLDHTAARVWPGWTNYRDFPFRLNFENGLRVLVGHPGPPIGYVLVPGLQVDGRPVHIDTRQVEPLRLDQPLQAGGGVSSLGRFDGKPVTLIDITLARPGAGTAGGRRFQAETTILTYIHELFHCFQEDHIRVPYPNFRYNPDTRFAAYSEIEGSALAKAYEAGHPEEAQRFLEDFLTARKLKRADMSEFDARCESGDEVREGTAVYAEVRSLEALRSGFRRRLTGFRDPHYRGFTDVGSLLRTYWERLEKRKALTYSYLKGYEYGCFQALLLERLFPGWQARFSEKASLLDAELEWLVGRSGNEDDPAAARRFEEVYRFGRVRARHAKAVRERDAAYQEIAARQGRSYIVSFKPIRQFVAGLIDPRKKKFEVGLMGIFPHGVGTVRADDIEIHFGKVPTEVNQLYYFRLVDTDWRTRKAAYSIQFEAREGEDIYSGVTLTTPLFELRAPRVRLTVEPSRVKVRILSRVS